MTAMHDGVREPDAEPRSNLGDNDGLGLVVAVLERWRLVVGAPLLAAVLTFAVTFLLPKTYTARTVFLPPQQQQSMASAALASLGALANLAGGSVGAVKNSTEQYVSLLQSTTVADRIVDKFDLMKVYHEDLRVEARKELAKNVSIAAGRRDGLISVTVDDHDPKRAAEIANQYVEELRRLTSYLALTEAQQRRQFFEQQLAQTKERLVSAQLALQGSGFNQSAIKAEPKAAAEGYAKLRAEATAAEVRLQALRRNFADTAPEVQQQLAVLGTLRGELQKAETPEAGDQGPDYVGKYREFKYQETLFDLFARQYELARVDESREGALIQVVDTATPPEKKSRPRRLLLAALAAAAGLAATLLGLMTSNAWQRAGRDPMKRQGIARLRTALAGERPGS